MRDVEREDVEFISKTLGLQPVAHVDQLTPDKLGKAELVNSVQCGADKMVKITGIENMGNTVSVLCRGSNKLVIEEADRSLHDALCVLRCLVKKRFLTPGEATPRTGVVGYLGSLGRVETTIRSRWIVGLQGGLDALAMERVEGGRMAVVRPFGTLELGAYLW